ncbi:MAG: DUF2207 domain-containing protein, partial [Bacteroidota bacterium]
MKKISNQFLLLLISCLLLTTSAFAQEERILSYDVVLEVMKDRSIKVKEDIVVNATGNAIKRGITRSLPHYRTFQGKKTPIRYNITKVLRDGKPEGYQTGTQYGNEIMYIGRRDVLLKPGQYHYTIEYNVPRQVELLEQIDEIYWNAIGQDVKFPIDKASCLVQLPAGANHLQKA